MEEKNTKGEEMEAVAMDGTTESNLEATKEEMEGQAHEVKVEELMEKLSQKEEELHELNNRLMRLSADFQNHRKRVEKEKADLYQFANEKMIIDLLPILDNLERALHSSKEEGNKEDGIVEGIAMVLQQFKDILKKHGVEEIQAQDATFDPNMHHAVMQEDHDGYESNRIIDVFQKGYTLHGKVIRPSMVKVAN
ncbi:nucleotide exchange factor GrpE [Thermotalea metallivorans]|uniref:nucleotide exchange factor GrpE n=1 Tax=Thermotalea metallivorans TaxID=520762 RepID=UPI0008396CD6|nr:nucleotide exchange factor GrpE [Thermotalea metallivorans]